MIQANELRIGNWVFDEDMPNGGGNGNMEIDTLVLSDIGMFGLRGIILTPQIMELCGFVYKDCYRLENFWFTQYDYTQIRFWINGNYGGIIHCEFLHQLQNLYFALTGKEIEVKL